VLPLVIRQEFMAKYYFARQEGKEMASKLVDMQRTVCQQWLEKFSPANVIQRQKKFV
jgi:hypothetical protein